MFKYSKDGVSVLTILDIRRAKINGLFPVKVQVVFRRKQKYYSTGKELSKEDWDNNIMSQVESSLKTKMVYQALAKKADLVPSDSDYNKEAETLAQQNSLSVKELESTYGKKEVEYAVITQRVQKLAAVAQPQKHRQKVQHLLQRAQQQKQQKLQQQQNNKYLDF